MGSEEAGQVALLDLAVTLHPVFREDLVLGIVQGAFSPQVVEHAGDPLAKALRRDSQGVSPFLNPGQGHLKPVVLHLHPSPGFQAERLPSSQRDFAQHLEAKIFATLLPVASTGALAADHLPHLRDQRAGESLVCFQQVVEKGRQISHRTRPFPDAFGHQRP